MFYDSAVECTDIYPEGAVILAPLSGYTDLAYRMSCRRHGCRFAFTPLIDAGSLLFGKGKGETGLSLRRGREEPWLGVQLLGADPAKLGECARLLAHRDFDLLDFNMGCPVPKVMKRGAGAALSGNRPLALKCLDALVQGSAFPVTAKIRVLDHENPEPTVAYARALEETGIRALTVHGRVWDKVYSGPVAFRVISAVRDALKIPVIANGGAMDRDSAFLLRRESGCSRIMIARGSMGNPWIFRELADPPGPPPTHEEICDEVERHGSAMMDLYGERDGIIMARKIILAYLVGRGYRRVHRRDASRVRSRREFEEFLRLVRVEGTSPRYSGRQS